MKYSIKLKKTGFISDFRGGFSHNSNFKELEVSITVIGYKKLKIKLKSKIFNVIALEEEVFNLDEVIINSNKFIDKERILLNKVKKNFKFNYPQKLERLHGRVVEVFSKDKLFKDTFYKASANVQVDKLSYKTKNRFGNVNVIDGSVEFSKSKDSTFIQIYAGVHNVHRFDVVARRYQPFNNIENKNYKFKLTDTISYNNKLLFKMKFETPSYNGFLYIQDSTYALVKAEYFAKNKKLKNKLSGISRLYLNFITEYKKKIIILE